MLTIDFLICSLNSRIVRVPDLLLPPMEGVRYVVSFQYTKDEYLTMLPRQLEERADVQVVKLRGEGLSANRNNALKFAASDLLYIIDDDTRLLPNTPDTIRRYFNLHPEADIALFKAQTYAGRDLRVYPGNGEQPSGFRSFLHVQTCEMVCRREKVQGQLFFDNRFGLGSHGLECFEEQIWLEDARRKHLCIRYQSDAIAQTSALYRPRMFYVDSRVQCSLGGLLYYVFGSRAYPKVFSYALKGSRRRLSHFWPVFRNLMRGAYFIRKTSKGRNL